MPKYYIPSSMIGIIPIFLKKYNKPSKAVVLKLLDSNEWLCWLSPTLTCIVVL